MNFLKRILGIQKEGATLNNAVHDERIRTIKANTDKLWAYLHETVDYYNSLSCACAFPRFRQIVSLDCTDYSKSFYASETEGFISIAAENFERETIETGIEAANEIWTCKKCGSTYHYGWSDFSIHVNRTFLKIIDHKTIDIGARPLTPLPLFVGLFGHTFPDHSIVNPVDFETLSSYIRELNQVGSLPLSV